MNESTQWRCCSTCRKSIPFGTRYYRCSVSTCNRSRLPLFFCSVGCWDAHVPTLRHRDAWAEEETAPSREEEAEHERQAERSSATTSTSTSTTTSPTRRIVAPDASDASGVDPALAHDILVVMSKLKQYIRVRSGMNTSDGVAAVLSDHLRALCDDAIEQAKLE